MLTSTYALVAFSVEQTELRKDLLLCRAHAREQFHLDRSAVDAAAGVLAQLQRRCAWRKLERYLVPALRQAGRAADALLLELEALAARAAGVLTAMQARLAGGAGAGTAWLAEICAEIELYCALQLERLLREETELFPLARKLVSRDAWFAMARQIMQDEPGAAGRERAAGTSPGARAAQPVDRRAAPLTPWTDGEPAGLAPALI